MKTQELDLLIGQIESAVAYYEEGSIDWRAIWDAIKQTGKSFNEVQFASHEEREREWKRYQSTVGQVKDIQTTEFERKKQFRGMSERHLSRIESLVEQSLPDSGLGQVILTLATGGLNLIGKAALDAIFGKLDEELEVLKYRSQKHREAGAYFKENKHEMMGRHKHTAHESLGHARERLNDDWDEYKSRRQAAHDARHEAWEDGQRQFAARQEQWRSNQYAFLDRLAESKDRLETVLGHKLRNRDKLSDMKSNARGDDFRREVEGWDDENEAAIDSISVKISSIEDKMREVRDKLRE
jgi:hypothetical protein